MQAVATISRFVGPAAIKKVSSGGLPTIKSAPAFHASDGRERTLTKGLIAVVRLLQDVNGDYMAA